MTSVVILKLEYYLFENVRFHDASSSPVFEKPIIRR
jgi:hypothetical protein